MKIYNKTISKGFLNFVVDKVKVKKELTNLDNSFIFEYMRKYLEQNTKLLDTIVNLENVNKISKNKSFSSLIKYIRREARLVYGMFQKPSEVKKRQLLLEKLKISDDKNKIIQEILKTHISTKERLVNYEQLIIKVDTLIKNKSPVNIIDLGSGINPFAFFNVIKERKVNYVANELNYVDASQLNEFFDYVKSINPDFVGKAYGFDLRKNYELIPQIIEDNFFKKGISFCFMFKIIEILEKYKKHFSFNLFNNLKSIDYFFVSFPKITLSNLKTTNTRRYWFEKMLEKLELKFEIFEQENEIFYICFR